MQDRARQDRKGIIDFLELLEKNIKEELAKKDSKLTIEEMAELYGKQTDAVILEAMRFERLAFVGGKLFIQITPDMLGYEVGMEAYFQRPDGEWVVKRNLTKPRSLEDLLLDSRSELKQLKRIEFELTKPK